MKKILVLCAVIAALILTGCKKDSDAIVIWQTMDPLEMETFSKIVDAFREEYPEIAVEVQLVPFNDARENFIRAAQGGNAPDVLRCEIAWTPLFADLGFLVPIEDYIPAEERRDYLEAPLNYNLFLGHLWGIPQVTDCLALMYNKRIFEEAGVSVPTTMDELLAVATALTDRENDKYGIFIPADAYFVQPFIWAFGGGLISDERQIEINSDASVRGLEFFMRLREAAMPSTVAINTQNEERDEGFKAGKYAMVFQGPWSTSDMLTGREFADNPDNLGIAVIPRGPAGYGSPVGGHNYVISRDAKNVEDAVTFIRFLNRAENQVLFATRNNLLPTRFSAYDDPSIQENRILQNFKDQLNVANNRPVIPEGGEIYPDFTRNFQMAFEGEITPRSALEQTAQDWQKLLD